MRFYARVNSIEKKEVVSEDRDGKKVKKLLHLAKLAEIGGIRLRLVSEEPFERVRRWLDLDDLDYGDADEAADGSGGDEGDARSDGVIAWTSRCPAASAEIRSPTRASTLHRWLLSGYVTPTSRTRLRFASRVEFPFGSCSSARKAGGFVDRHRS